MDRRSFVLSSGIGIAALASAEALAQQSGAATGVPQLRTGGKPVLARLGHQIGNVTDEICAFLARYGVEGIAGSVNISEAGRLYNTVDEMKKMREIAEKRGLKVEVIDSILLHSSNVDREANPSIVLGQSPQRDREIEAFQEQIRNCAAAGIPCLKYNMSILGVVRSGTMQGRGDAQYSQWRLADAPKDQPLTKAGMVNADEFWKRITYFLERVVPVANEYKIRLACHPQDPGLPPEGYRGVSTVLGTVDGLKRFVSIHESPYHGLNFCQGTVSEDLADPGKEIFDVIRYFGSRNKIFNVHFRNIRGRRDDFVETFPDEGDVDFVKAIQVYREVGYSGFLMPDHAPRVPNVPEASAQSFAFAFGHIRGLLQSAQYIA